MDVDDDSCRAECKKAQSKFEYCFCVLRRIDAFKVPCDNFSHWEITLVDGRSTVLIIVWLPPWMTRRTRGMQSSFFSRQHIFESY